jgi:hypothetical protein
MSRLRLPQGKICSQNGADLHGISGGNRETRKDPALGGGGRIHAFSFQVIPEDDEALQIFGVS